MIKLHYFIKQFLARRLTGRSIQLLQFEYLVYEVGIFVINNEVLISSVASREHGGHKIKDIFSCSHRADRNMGGQLY